jgi:hypothetical protein
VAASQQASSKMAAGEAGRAGYEITHVLRAL